MQKQTEIKARVLDRLIEHLDKNKDVQNIDLMILAKFCRNCLSKWMVEEANHLNVDLDLDVAREEIYRMSYNDWKEKHQTEVSQEKLDQYQQSRK